MLIPSTHSCPVGLELRPMQRRHATLVNEAWPSRHEGSLAWFEHVIDNNPSVGLYPVDGEDPIGWTLK